MEVKNKWDPGKEPIFPSRQGMTEKPGLTIRASFAKDFAVALTGRLGPTAAPGEEVCGNVVNKALMLADYLIMALYPEPVAKVHAAQQEMSSCQHPGELIFDKGKALCMKCKQVVPKEILIARMK